MGQNKEGICKYCKCRKKLCKAHITPECFYDKKKNEPFLQIQADDFVKRLPIGYYDDGIICAECDNSFSNSEDYAKKVFDDAYLKKYKNENIYVLNKPAFEYVKIRKFILSMLWKASVSSSKGCSCINLGKYEDIVLRILKGKQPDNPDLFKIFIVKFKEREMRGCVALKKSRISGNIAYSFICHGFMFYIIPRFGFNVTNEYYTRFCLKPDCMVIVEVSKNFNGAYDMFKEMMFKQIKFMNAKKGGDKHGSK